MKKSRTRSELKSTSYEIFIGILSVMSIMNLVLVYAIEDQALMFVLGAMNALFSVIFLGDFVYRLATAPSRSGYFWRGFGWADLLASLPFPQFKVLRVFRLVRVFRLMRQLGLGTVWRTLSKDRAGSALMVLLLMGILVLQYGSLMMLALEKDAEGANITTASDALWYSIVTMSTVGYGDRFPVTNLGRLGGAVIIVVGVGIFGTFTGYLANLFLGSKEEGAADAVGGSGEAVADAGGAPLDAGGASRPSDAELRALAQAAEENLAAIRKLLDQEV
jgi:voltage-gated potassium channel Kch